MIQPAALPARVRLNDERLKRSVRALATEWVSVPIGTVANGAGGVVAGTFAFGTYATGGVSITGLGSATFVGMEPWTDGIGAVFLFKWNATTHKMQVMDWAGTEIGNGYDMSAIADHPYTAIVTPSSSSAEATAQVRLAGGGRILAVEIEVDAAFTGDSTNYWVVTAYLRRADALSAQSVGEAIGSISTAALSLVAQEPVALYSSDRGVVFHESDRLVVSAVAHGSPLPLAGAAAWANISRSVN